MRVGNFFQKMVKIDLFGEIIPSIVNPAKYIPGASWWLSGEESTCQCRGLRFDLQVEKLPWRRQWQPMQYSCLGNHKDRGACQVTVH